MKDNKMFGEIFAEIKHKSRRWKIENIDRGSDQEL